MHVSLCAQELISIK